jgi:hypothetical protein
MKARRVLAVLLVMLFVSAPVYALASDRQTILIVGTLVALLLLIVYVGNDDEKEDTDSWKPIPSWQYGGRFAELGGLTRDEQEEAVQEVQRKAEEMDTEKNS